MARTIRAGWIGVALAVMLASGQASAKESMDELEHVKEIGVLLMSVSGGLIGGGLGFLAAGPAGSFIGATVLGGGGALLGMELNKGWGTLMESPDDNRVGCGTVRIDC